MPGRDCQDQGGRICCCMGVPPIKMGTKKGRIRKTDTAFMVLPGQWAYFVHNYYSRSIEGNKANSLQVLCNLLQNTEKIGPKEIDIYIIYLL